MATNFKGGPPADDALDDPVVGFACAFAEDLRPMGISILPATTCNAETAAPSNSAKIPASHERRRSSRPHIDRRSGGRADRHFCAPDRALRDHVRARGGGANGPCARARA